MLPEQTRLLAESFSKLENRLYDLGSLIFQKLFEISPESRSLFKGDMEEQKLKLARVFAQVVRLKTRSHHFMPVTGKGGEVIIPGVGALGARHEINYGVRDRHYGYMREALLYAISTLLGSEYNEEIGRAWGETFDMLAGAMQKHAGQNAEAVAFAKLFHQKGAPEAGPFIEWSDKLSVGFEQIDNEHKKLLDLLNVLNGAIQGGAGQGLLGGVLDSLIHYAAYHFTHEEDLFQRSDYPAFEAHRRQHQAFTARVKEMCADFHTEATAVQPGQVLEFLKDWLQHHIMESDRAFTAYLKAKRLRLSHNNVSPLKDFNEEVAAAWGETFNMLAEAMRKHAGGNPDAEALARIFTAKTDGAPSPEGSADRFLKTENEADPARGAPLKN